MIYENRLKKVRNEIQAMNCDALLVEDTLNLYYLTGIQVSLGRLLVKKNAAIFIVDNRYYELCKNIPFLQVVMSEKTPFESTLNDIATLVFDAETTTYQNYLNLQKLAKDKTALVPVKNLVQKIRSIKDAQELVLMREAAVLGWKGFEYIQALLKDDIKEIELAAELEIFWKKSGSQGVAFEPIIAFGSNSAMPHYRASEARLQRGDTVLIDIGVKWKGYNSDMSRTLFWGQPKNPMLQVFDIVAEAQQRALALCKPGTLIKELDDAARAYITNKGYGSNFLHSLGHGVGLEIHEWPLIRKSDPYQNIPLVEGMVITIEPGIYLPGIGGVRIEDTVAITSTGHENLTLRTHHFL